MYENIQQTAINYVNIILKEIQTFEHGSILIINVLLFLFAKSIVKFFEHSEEHITFKTSIFRNFNIIFFIFHIIDIVYINYYPDYKNLFFKIGISGFFIYISYFLSIYLNHLNKSKFGDKTEIDGKVVKVETYASQLTNILIKIFILFITIVFLINYWGYNSLLEATGIIGLFIGFIALTSSVWSPDILNGLILLNSKLYSEGDIIEFDGKRYIIFKFGYSRITLLDIKNNHRTSVKNSVLAEKQLDNVTKIASTDGFRETIEYKIGYGIDFNATKEERLKQYKENKEKINKMLEEAYEECLKDKNIMINDKIKSFEVLLKETGDFALHYTVSFYVKKPNSTNTTSTARSYLKTISLVNEKIYEAAVREGVDLSTPNLHEIKNV